MASVCRRSNKFCGKSNETFSVAFLHLFVFSACIEALHREVLILWLEKDIAEELFE